MIIIKKKLKKEFMKENFMNNGKEKTNEHK